MVAVLHYPVQFRRDIRLICVSTGAGEMLGVESKVKDTANIVPPKYKAPGEKSAGYYGF